jgi:hypothetical protein
MMGVRSLNCSVRFVWRGVPYSRRYGADVTIARNVGHTSRLFVIWLLGVGQVCSSRKYISEYRRKIKISLSLSKINLFINYIQFFYLSHPGAGIAQSA